MLFPTSLQMNENSYYERSIIFVKVLIPERLNLLAHYSIYCLTHNFLHRGHVNNKITPPVSESASDLESCVFTPEGALMRLQDRTITFLFTVWSSSTTTLLHSDWERNPVTATLQPLQAHCFLPVVTNKAQGLWFSTETSLIRKYCPMAWDSGKQRMPSNFNISKASF